MGLAGSDGLAGARSARPQRLIRPLNGIPIWSNGSFRPSARTGLWVADLTHVATWSGSPTQTSSPTPSPG